MEELRIRDEQLHNVIEEGKALALGLKTSARKQQDADLLKDKLESGQHALDAMGIELNGQPKIDLQKKYREKHRAYKAQLRELQNEFEWVQHDQRRTELLGASSTERNEIVVPTEHSLIQYGTNLDGESKASLQRSVGVVAATRELAVTTAAKIDQQTEQMGGLLSQMEHMDDTLNRSITIIRRLGRRVLTDKCVWLMTGLVVIAIVFIVVWKYEHPNQSGVAVPLPCSKPPCS